MSIIGIKKPNTISEKTISDYSKKFNIPLTDIYELDTSYVTFLFALDTAKYKRQMKNHYQPLQASYYDKSGQLLSFQLNCYAGGFPNLKWNRNSTLSTFPPKQHAPVDSIVPLGPQLKFLRPLSQTAKLETEKYDYIVVLYWSNFMGRQSKRVIRFIQDNREKYPDMKVKIVYANNDNIFSIPTKKR